MAPRHQIESSELLCALFPFHRIHGSRIKLTNDNRTATRLESAKFYDNGVVYSALPLSGHSKFIVEVLEHGASWSGSFKLGIILVSRDVFGEGFRPPRYSPSTPQSWVWSSCSLHVGADIKISYGRVNLENIKKGDRIGMVVSSEGQLNFMVNEEPQGIAANRLYNTDDLVYGFVDHYGQAVTSTISVGFVNPFTLLQLCRRVVKRNFDLGEVEKLDVIPKPLLSYLHQY